LKHFRHFIQLYPPMHLRSNSPLGKLFGQTKDFLMNVEIQPLLSTFISLQIWLVTRLNYLFLTLHRNGESKRTSKSRQNKHRRTCSRRSHAGRINVNRLVHSIQFLRETWVVGNRRESATRWFRSDTEPSASTECNCFPLRHSQNIQGKGYSSDDRQSSGIAATASDTALG
jgi:hypothetical protein